MPLIVGVNVGRVVRVGIDVTVGFGVGAGCGTWLGLWEVVGWNVGSWPKPNARAS